MPRVTIPPERQSARLQSARILAQNVRYQTATSPGARQHNTSMGTKRDARGNRKVDYSSNDDQRLPAALATQLDDGSREEDGEQDDDNDEFYDAPSETDDSKPADRPIQEAYVRKYTMEELGNLIDSDLLDLNPEYQRDVVWTLKNMSSLIGSIIENYFVPPIIFNKHNVVLRTGEKTEKRICVDGKQRLSSIAAFLRGDIPYTDSKGRKWYYCEPASKPQPGCAYSKTKPNLLPEEYKKGFRHRSLIAYEYKDISSVQEEELFARVQKGVPLNASEKLRATHGPWQSLAKVFEEEFKSVASLSVDTRGAAFRHFLTSFGQIIENFSPCNSDGRPRTMVQLPATQSFCKKRKAECTAATKHTLRQVFSKFQNIATRSPVIFQDNNYKTGSRNFAPIEFVAVACLIAKHKGARSEALLGKDISALRAHLRESLPDMRMCNASWKMAWEFIRDLELIRGAGDQSESEDTQSEFFLTMRENHKSATTPENEHASSRRSSNARSLWSTPGSARTPPSGISSSTSVDIPTLADRQFRRQDRSPSTDSVLGDDAQGSPPSHVEQPPNFSPAVQASANASKSSSVAEDQKPTLKSRLGSYYDLAQKRPRLTSFKR